MDESGQKKVSFEDLSRDDLIKKCKGLLTIAQKAKQAKKDVSAECEALVDKCEKLEAQRAADADSLRTVREVIDTLTEQKLHYATELDAFKQKNAQLSASLDLIEAERERHVQSSRTALEKLSNFEIENISFKRQNARLQTENEELTTQLDKLEAQIEILNKLGLEQQRELLRLENLPQDAPFESESNLFEKCEMLTKSLTEKDMAVSRLEQEVKTKDLNISEITEQLESEKSKKEKANLKLKSYKEKLIKCNVSIAQLKKSKSVLLKTVQDYSESVPKWQTDILNASKLLSKELLRLESENEELKNKLSCEDTNKHNYEEMRNKMKTLSKENDTLTSKLDYITVDLKKLEDENLMCSKELKTIKADYDLLLGNYSSVESEKYILVTEKTNAKETLQRVEAEKALLINLNESLTTENGRLCNEISSLKHKIENEIENVRFENAEIQVNAINDESIAKLKEELSSMKCALVAVEEENKLLCESNDSLKNQLNQPSDEPQTLEMRKLSEQNDMLQTDISKLQTKISSYKSEHSALHGELKELRQKLSEVEDYETVKAKCANYKSENAELLKEMKEINQALKERGEVISKQQMEISDYVKKTQVLEEELKTLRENVENEIQKVTNSHIEKYHLLSIEKENTEALLTERDSIITSLQDDIEKLKMNNSNLVCDTRSDNLSVSTMSKIEESSRLKDVDESFEERYAKLRALAIKLKKHLGELTIRNKSLEESNAKYEEENKILTQKVSNIGGETKIEETKISPSGTFSKDMEKASFDIIVKELKAQIEVQKVTIDELQTKGRELSSLRDTLALKESQLALEESQHHATKDALEKAKREVKKKSVLSLEMEDYEKSMKDMTNKMEEDKKKIVQMESTIDTQQATVTSFKTQIKMLEEQLSTEERISREVKELLSKATSNLKENESSIQIKNEEIHALQSKVEDYMLQIEDVNLQLAASLGEKEKNIIRFENEKSELIAKFKTFENRHNCVEEMLTLKTTELNELKNEFSNYKVRAQSVLRQNNNKDLSMEENLKEEMAAFKAEVHTLRGENENLRSQLESIQSERCHLLIRCGELQSTITITQAEREKLAEQYSLLLQKEAQEQKNIQLQMTTLTQCYKKQIADLEESMSDQIGRLKKELEFSRASIARTSTVSIKDVNSKQQQTLQFIAIDSVQSSNESGDEHIPDSIDSVVNVSMLEREEGEGSESTPSPSPTVTNKINRQLQRGKREPIPLDQLLTGTIAEDSLCPFSDSDIEEQLMNALKQIEIRDKRLSHMTELVAEAEKEVARRTQLIETLKEEVRRCQRALDRGVHHHNQEYLKNVIVKFLTLNAGDERSRLVPVLNTILTLSPEETNQLNAVAKGFELNANRGWGSYLSWPSSNR